MSTKKTKVEIIAPFMDYRVEVGDTGVIDGYGVKPNWGECAYVILDKNGRISSVPIEYLQKIKG